MVDLTETLCFRLHIETGERTQLGQARFDAQAIANHALAMWQLGYSKLEICDQPDVQTLDFVQNNAQAVARKACESLHSTVNPAIFWQPSSWTTGR